MTPADARQPDTHDKPPAPAAAAATRSEAPIGPSAFRPPWGSWCVGHAIILVTILSIGFFGFVRKRAQGGMIESMRRPIEAKEPRLLIVGNSIANALVDDELFSEELGVPAAKVTEGGSASAWWYLVIKNVVVPAEHRPRVVALVFRDIFLTHPTFRVDGRWRLKIRQVSTQDEPLVARLSYPRLASIGDLGDMDSPFVWFPLESRRWLDEKVRRRTENVLAVKRGSADEALEAVFAEDRMVSEQFSAYQLQAEVVDDPALYDFDGQLPQSFLPHIVKTAHDAGMQLVLIRAKRRRDAEGGVPPAEQAMLDAYMTKLRDYAKQHDVMFIDLAAEPSITIEHFRYGDHASPEGRPFITRLLADRLREDGRFQTWMNGRDEDDRKP